MRLLGDRIEQAAAGPGGQDYKTRLQELCARRFDELPYYVVADEGPDHAKSFDASVRVAGQVWGTGQGRSKKQAEQAAARVAWAAIMATTPVDAADAAAAAAPVEPNDDEQDGAVPAPSGDGDGDTAPTGAESAGLATPDAASAPAAGRA